MDARITGCNKSGQRAGNYGSVPDNRALKNGVKLDFSRPGITVDNSFIESFNRTVRNEWLDDNWFLNLNRARGGH
jgi:putative transposase